MSNVKAPAPKLLSVEISTDAGGNPGWKITFELWPKRASYAVFLPGGCPEEDIVRLAKGQLAAEIAALAKALAG